ncbi:MAG: EamA family transporter [Candidatus Eisenbacteria sp.]|nr:EamA family transporter [Candidatus Eisenbacteria bacterium]
MSTPLFMVLIAVVFSVAGEIFFKEGMNRVGVLTFSTLGPTAARMIRTWPFYAGCACFLVSVSFWFAAISRVDLSWAYPLLATGYILMLLFSAIILGEHVSPLRWLGAVVIVIGVALVSRT